MTDAEVLEACIRKAIEGGFDMRKAIGRRYKNDSFQLHIEPRHIKWSEYEDGASLIYWLIFNHDFAKALWVKTTKHRCICQTPECHCGSKQEEWQYHLQQMVIAEDPIAYLKDHA
jgi:hypothetical protein